MPTSATIATNRGFCAIFIMLAAALLASLCTWARSAEPAAMITFADTDVAIIRRTTLYRATTGTLVRNADIVETHDGAAQFEVPPAAMFLLSAHSRVLVRIGHAGAAGCDILVYSLESTLKIERKASAPAGLACLQAAPIRTTLASGSVLQRFDGSAVSIFAENGGFTMQDMSGSASSRKPIEIRAEHFTQWHAGKPIEILDRPTPEFLVSIPSSFRDALVPMADRLQGATTEPVALRAVSYADVSPWLKDLPQFRREFVQQFLPRLKDPEFRRQLDAELGKSPEWGPILHPAPPQDDTRQ
jgi:hypothetical protein